MELFQMISWTLDPNMQATDTTTPIALSGFYKSLLSIYGSYKLTIEGQYGSARILLRHALEYLLIAKYCSLSGKNSLIEKWGNGDDISLEREVLSKLVSPLPIRFRGMWKLLCQFTHATVYSQQVEFEAEKNEKEISTNFAFIKAFLEMNYHLLNRHLINNPMKFYFECYEKEEGKFKFKSLKKDIKSLFSISKKNILDETKGVVKDYISSWQLNN
jgi:hypothetical protein